jgi:hypothetical protein
MQERCFLRIQLVSCTILILYICSFRHHHAKTNVSLTPPHNPLLSWHTRNVHVEMALTAGPQLVWPRPSPNNQPPAEHTVDPSYVHLDPCTTHWQQLRGSPQTSTYLSTSSKLGSTQVFKTMMNTHRSQDSTTIPRTSRRMALRR